MTAVLGLCISLIALFVSLTALLIAKRQLDEARTANGGRGFTLKVRHVAPHDLDAETRAQVIGAFDKSVDKYIVFEMSFRVRGPGEYFDVTPYTWSNIGCDDPFEGSSPIPRLAWDDGEIRVFALVQLEAVESLKLGVLWSQPWGDGMETAGIRGDLQGNLERWMWRESWVSRCIPRAKKGGWCAVKQSGEVFGPGTQPWESAGGQSRGEGPAGGGFREGQYPV